MTSTSEASNSQLLLAVLHSPFTPFSDDLDLALPHGWEEEACENQRLHKLLVRDINLDGVVVVSQANHDGCRCVNIAIL